MASGAVSTALDRDSIETLAKVSAAGKALSSVHLFLGEASDGANPSLAICHVVQVRAHGFMLAIPNSPDVQDFLQSIDAGSMELPEFHGGVVELQSSRGKKIGEADILLVDLPWNYAPFFSRPVNLKTAAFRSHDVVQLTVADQVGRPGKASVLALAEAWISGEVWNLEQPQSMQLPRRMLGPVPMAHCQILATLASMGLRCPAMCNCWKELQS